MTDTAMDGTKGRNIWSMFNGYNNICKDPVVWKHLFGAAAKQEIGASVAHPMSLTIEQHVQLIATGKPSDVVVKNANAVIRKTIVAYVKAHGMDTKKNYEHDDVHVVALTSIIHNELMKIDPSEVRSGSSDRKRKPAKKASPATSVQAAAAPRRIAKPRATPWRTPKEPPLKRQLDAVNEKHAKELSELRSATRKITLDIGVLAISFHAAKTANAPILTEIETLLSRFVANEEQALQAQHDSQLVELQNTMTVDLTDEQLSRRAAATQARREKKEQAEQKKQQQAFARLEKRLNKQRLGVDAASSSFSKSDGKSASSPKSSSNHKAVSFSDELNALFKRTRV